VAIFLPRRSPRRCPTAPAPCGRHPMPRTLPRQTPRDARALRPAPCRGAPRPRAAGRHAGDRAGQTAQPASIHAFASWRIRAAPLLAPWPCSAAELPAGGRDSQYDAADMPSEKDAATHRDGAPVAQPRVVSTSAQRGDDGSDLHEPSGSQPVYLRSKLSSGLPADLGPANIFNRQFGG
jgi:hypothetical protein